MNGSTMLNEAPQNHPGPSPETPARSARPDPRIARTRSHIIAVAREALAERSGPLTFSTIAQRAQVSRQTLYIHWGTIEALIADTVPADAFAVGNDDTLDSEAKLTRFLTQTAATMTGQTGGAIAHLMTAATYSDTARAALERIESDIISIAGSVVGPLSSDEYARLVNPVVASALMHDTVSQSLIESLVRSQISTSA